jgi:hypothetical protein
MSSAPPAVKFAILGDAFVDISVGALPPHTTPRRVLQCSKVSLKRRLTKWDGLQTNTALREILRLTEFTLSHPPPPSTRPPFLPVLPVFRLSTPPHHALFYYHDARSNLKNKTGPLDALPQPGGDVEVSTVSQGPGGSALNTAWHLAAQDVPTTLHAAVGLSLPGVRLVTWTIQVTILFSICVLTAK